MPHTHIEPVLILGGGLAGLSTAFHLRRPWLLVEKESRVGGLVRTEVMHGGFRFDPTGHWLHLRDPGMKALVHEQLLPDGLVTVARRAAVFTRGVFTRFPYQVNTHGLPAEVVAENLVGFVEATAGEGGRALREREPPTSRSSSSAISGAGFAKNFMVPYNTKLFGVPPRELSAAWCGRFVPRPTPQGGRGRGAGAGLGRARLQRELRLSEGGRHRGARPRAPRGASRRRLGRFASRTEPIALDWERRAARLSDGQRGPLVGAGLDHPAAPRWWGCSHRVPDEVRAAAARLRATDVTWVAVGARGHEPSSPGTGCTCPSPSSRPTASARRRRCSPGRRPRGPLPSTWSTRDHARPRPCARAAVEDLVRAKMIRSAADVLFAEPRVIRNAYVLYDASYGEARETVIASSPARASRPPGATGNWEYSSMEDALLGGRAAAEQVERA